MDPLAQLLVRDQYGIKFGLDNIRTLCQALDHPERAWTSLIVGGTNGKGSVTAMTAAALTAAGYRTGRYTSPHLIRLDERFAIDNQPVAPLVLQAAAAHVLEAEERCLRQGRLTAPMTFFEITTATAFQVFRQAGAHVVVLEVGMGGRFDATNAADPVAGAITSIALDHTRFLGRTIPEIAFEKAGIARRDRPLVVGSLPPEAYEVIGRVGRTCGAHVVDALSQVESTVTVAPDGQTTLSLRTPAAAYGSFPLALRGRHQVLNAIVAVRLLEAAASAGVYAGVPAVVAGLSRVSWPGRLQEIVAANGRRVLLDAAHNPAGAAALSAFLTEIHAPRAVFVFGAMRDKDIGAMLMTLQPHASGFIFTQASSARAMDAADLVAEAARVGIACPVSAAASPHAALDLALHDAAFVVVAGSIFLLGDLLPVLEAPSRSGQAAGPSSACGILRRGPR